ncbi:molybdopterin synthase sulfur carrier subunit [Asaia sp. W19]|nr:molybdopterin synthase sulfur carrier subunit [Asaia sp. W19]
MASVTLEYFALLRDEAGCQSETLRTEAPDLAALYDALAHSRGFTLPRARLRVAVNARFAPWDQPVSEGDHIVFIPPVSGG